MTEPTPATCGECGHSHSPTLGYICVGCPCPETPGKPAPTIRYVTYLNSFDDECPRRLRIPVWMHNEELEVAW